MIKHYYLLITFFLLSMSLYSQQNNPITDYKHYIENEQVIGEHKLPAHASFTSFSTHKERKANKSKYYKLLSGSWKFNWVRNPNERPTTFMNETFDVSSINLIHPKWQSQSFFP